MNLTVFTDGGARGNPGPAGFGVTIYHNLTPLATLSGYLGIKTNNEAEYAGLIFALSWLKDHQEQYNFKTINFQMDSQLLCRQMQGVYKIKSPNLKPLKLKADSLVSSLHAKITFTDILREKNQLADELANLAMDTKKPLYEI